MKPITYRIAILNDFEGTLSLMKALWPDSDHDELARDFAACLADIHQDVVLALDEDALIGFAWCSIRNDYVEGSSTSPVGYLEGIYVVEAYRVQGIARELCSRCENWAKDQGCSEFASDCELDNVISARFHENIGFTEANRIVCFIKSIG